MSKDLWWAFTYIVAILAVMMWTGLSIGEFMIRNGVVR